MARREPRRARTFQPLAAPVAARSRRAHAGLAALGLLIVAACTSSPSTPGKRVDPCPTCVADRDCPRGTTCAQFSGDTFCTPRCTSTCAADLGDTARSCTAITSAEGKQVDVCVPITDACGQTPALPALPGSRDAGTVAADQACGPLLPPSTPGCCRSCNASRADCQANGCYGGWYCDSDTCRCRWPPRPETCALASVDAGPRPDAGPTPDAGPPLDGGVGASGGTLDVLSFAIVGDTRPASEDDTAGYPVSVIQRIWSDIEAASPRPAFALTTGDYVFASPYTAEADKQLDLYLAARHLYSGTVFTVIGNHECTGATTSNCGPGTASGSTRNYDAFMRKMMAPLGKSTPYFTERVDAVDGKWTAKFVFVAANAWTDAQATWLEAELSVPTTYTFLVRHESQTVTRAPGVTPSEEIIQRHPLTLRIVGHAHTLSYSASQKELIVGNGGAPLSSSVNFGYVLARQRPDRSIELRAIDYASGQAFRTFSVTPDGTFGP